MCRIILLSSLLLAAPAAVAFAHSPASPFALCESAIAAAEFTAHLPPRMLDAIATEESGRPDPATGRLRPWPWTINVEGEGQLFDTKAQAIAAVRGLQARGIRSIDVGCLQVNLQNHPDAFASLEEALDPGRNAGYAARFLDSLFSASHDWRQAIGAYHSATPALGAAYRVLVLARWEAPVLRPAPEASRGPYRAFPAPQSIYAAFAPRTQVYGAFAQPSPDQPQRWSAGPYPNGSIPR